MIYVIFEVYVKEGKMKEYLDLAGQLREDLLKNPGFVSSERFSSLQEEGKLLSLSVWKDEESLSQWRNLAQHRIKQKLGREEIFESYKISVTSQLRSYTMDDREEAPKDSNREFGL